MESMFTKFILALFLPGLLVVLFTRITFSHIVALILTVALITASVYAGYTHTWLLYVVDALSLTIGFWYATLMMKRGKKQEN
ncbi:CsbA family protein [Paenisporosarcina macmurdoensis]|jgi:general stress protein CsbA|uniref:CsbA family protein n=1 Tax=Paenisporosarcina macmurdoensis TaxID=212659 RepID=A0ABW1L1H3_9BACL